MADLLSGGVGAVFGAGVSLLTTWVNSRTERWKIRRQESEREADNRRKAESQFLASAKRFEDSARMLASILDGAVDRDLGETHDEYHREWRNLHESEALVEITCPDNVGKTARDLRVALGRLRDVCDPWYLTFIKNGKANSRKSNFDHYIDNDITQERKNFHAARKAG